MYIIQTCPVLIVFVCIVADLLHVVGCMMLSPKTEVYQLAAVHLLSGLSAEHSRSDSSLFERCCPNPIGTHGWS